MGKTTIVEVRHRPFDVELTTPFGIATGAVAVARNVVVEVVLADGTIGLGEAAPFPAVNGETQHAVCSALESMPRVLTGMDAARLRPLSAAIRDAAPETPTVWCALETAALDAFTRAHGMSLWKYFGGAMSEIESDLTIVTGGADEAAAAARSAAARGFSVLKVKVGGVPLEDDIARLFAIARNAPTARFVLDGNTAFSADGAVEVIRALGAVASRVVLFEEPGQAGDLDLPRRIHESTRLPIAADESARSLLDVVRIGNASAYQVVNIKLSKSGIVEALDMISAARAHGLGLMIGGMVESKITMTTSACIAAGLGGFSFVDLDTPLFMKDGSTQGGYTQRGARLRVDDIPSGHGVSAGRAPKRKNKK